MSNQDIWPDLRNAGFHLHNSMTHFSPSNNSYAHWLTIEAIIDAESCWAAFAVFCFWGLSDIHECLGCIQMAAYPLGKQAAGCNSQHDWLMSLAMDLPALCDMWRWKWHQRMPFGWFWWRRSFCPPLRGYPPSGSATDIGYTSKKLSKMMGNSASYSPHSWWVDRL